MDLPDGHREKLRTRWPPANAGRPDVDPLNQPAFEKCAFRTLRNTRSSTVNFEPRIVTDIVCLFSGRLSLPPPHPFGSWIHPEVAKRGPGIRGRDHAGPLQPCGPGGRKMLPNALTRHRGLP
jgi:hypothetical protein